MKAKQTILLSLVVFSLLLVACKQQTVSSDQPTKSGTDPDHLKWVLKQLREPGNGNVIISAHRGDWRHAPENSLQSLKQCIEKNYDIVECDLKMSKDGHLIIMHDKTIDRTTTGKGSAADYTLEELKAFRLVSAGGHSTRHQIPSFEEFLQAAKGKAVLCLDKGYDYFEAAMTLVKQYDMEEQVIFNVPSVTLDSLKSQHPAQLSDKLCLNLLGFPRDTVLGNQLVDSYTSRGNVIFHPTFSSDTIPMIPWMASLQQKKIHLWLNALWPEHNAGHDDDIAVEDNKPDETWGWLIEKGATIIQTDRPEELLAYLKKAGKRK